MKPMTILAQIERAMQRVLENCGRESDQLLTPNEFRVELGREFDDSAIAMTPFADFDAIAVKMGYVKMDRSDKVTSDNGADIEAIVPDAAINEASTNAEVHGVYCEQAGESPSVHAGDAGFYKTSGLFDDGTQEQYPTLRGYFPKDSEVTHFKWILLSKINELTLCVVNYHDKTIELSRRIDALESTNETRWSELMKTLDKLVTKLIS